jgi:hypothetical protein
MTRNCPSCGAAIESSSETFCAACGHKLRSSDEEIAANIARSQADESLRQARKWLMIVAVLTWVSGAIFYFLGKAEVDKQIAQAERQTAGISPELRDQVMKRETGMTFQEAVDHDRGQVRLLLVVNIVLGAIYVGLWLWAAKAPLPATVIALLIFVTVVVVNVIIDPKTLAQGIIVKIAVIGGLGSAVAAAVKSRAAAARAA